MINIFINHYSLYKLHKDGNLFNVLENADRIYIDGQLLVYQLNAILGLNIERKSFDWSSIAYKVIKTENNILFWGGTEDEAKKFKKYIQQKLNTNIDAINGYSYKIEDVINLVDKENTTAIVIGQGSPLQENQCISISKNLRKNINLYTCGGFITQTAKFNNIYGSGFKYLPRWLVRCIRQPFVIKRLIYTYPLSVLLVFSHRAKIKTYYKKFL